MSAASFRVPILALATGVGAVMGVVGAHLPCPSTWFSGGRCVGGVARVADRPANAASIVRAAYQPEDDADAQMLAWREASMPSVHHKNLEPMIGTWTAEMTWQMAPDAPQQTATGEVTNEWVLDGRFIRQDLAPMDMMGEKFRGFGYLGYDNIEKKYVSTWMDSMSTGILLITGESDPAGKTITMTGSFTDAATGEKVQTKNLLKIVDQDKHTYEFYHKTPKDADFVKIGAIVYTRKGTQ